MVNLAVISPEIVYSETEQDGTNEVKTLICWIDPAFSHRDNNKQLDIKTNGCIEKTINRIIVDVSAKYRIESTLIKAMIMAESGFNPLAVSKRGARGLMQLMPNTAKVLGITDSFDPEQNIRGGVRYFRQLLDRFNGNIDLALAAYNSGSSKVRKYGGIPPFKATRAYLRNVFKYYRAFSRGPTEELHVLNSTRIK
jgi:soluble lytic murein transglycosylase-like protein